MLRRSWRRILFEVAAAGLLLWVVLGLLATRFSRDALSESESHWAAAFAPHEAEFKADIEALGRLSLFEARDGGDAATTLAEHIRFELGSPTNPTVSGASPLPPSLEADLRKWGADWTEHADDVRLEHLDLSWMSSLAGFGYWDLDEKSPAPFGSYAIAEPKMDDILMLAKVRLLAGLRRGDHVSAGAEVRELARILATTERLSAIAYVPSLLHFEARAWQKAKDQGLDVANWSPVSERARKRFGRALGTPLNLTLHRRLPAEVSLGPFQCASLNWRLYEAAFLSRYLKRPLRERYRELSEELAASSCRLRAARKHESSPEPEAGFPVSTLALCPSGVWVIPPCDLPDISLAWLPFVRFPLGTHLLLTDSTWTQPFKAYADPLPAGTE